MSFEQPGFQISRVANADLSAAQFKLVKLVAGGKVDLCTAVTDRPIGVLQNKPKAADVAQVMVVGESKLWAGGTVAVGDVLGTDTSSRGVTYVGGTDTTKYGVATSLEVGAVGQLIAALVDGLVAHRLA
jgi:hypothetical protein